MRLIDATALHRELVVEMVKCLRMSEETKGSMAERVLNKVDEAPTIETDTNVGSKWIPVTERLPDKYAIVLCYKGGKWRLGYYIGAEYSKEVAAFRHPKDQFSFGVTHWMPLPEPPEDGGAE